MITGAEFLMGILVLFLGLIIIGCLVSRKQDPNDIVGEIDPDDKKGTWKGENEL